MSISQNSTMTVGNVMVATTQNRGHSIDFHADRITDKLISVSENAHPAIKAQALHYKEVMRQIIYLGIKDAISSDRTTLINVLEKNGLSDFKTLIEALKSKTE